MMHTTRERPGSRIGLAGVLITLTVLAASGCTGPDAAEPGTGLTAQETASLRARSAEEVSVCHRARRRWVPLTLPGAAVESHVGNHGDFVYDTSAGQCCTDSDCAADQPCSYVLGENGPIGVCRLAGGPGPGTEAIGLLLTLTIFREDKPFSTTGTLRRDDTNNYFLSFTVNGINAEVPLATFVLTGTPPAENSSTPVTIDFPARNGGLIEFVYPSNFLNLSVTDSEFSGDGSVYLDNATIANFTLEISQQDPPIVFTNWGEAWAILGIRGVFVRPILYIGDGNGPAGFYMGLNYSGVTSNLLVFKGAVYDVRL